MYYGGESNVPGAAGNLFAGGPSFDIPRGPGACGITPGGGPQLPLAGIPGSSNLPGAVGNMGGIANATFYAGPQFNQPGNVSLPAGFQGKYVS